MGFMQLGGLNGSESEKNDNMLFNTIVHVNKYLLGDGAQIQREPPPDTIHHVVSWNIPEHRATPTYFLQWTDLGGEILS